MTRRFRNTALTPSALGQGQWLQPLILAPTRVFPRHISQVLYLNKMKSVSFNWEILRLVGRSWFTPSTLQEKPFHPLFATKKTTIAPLNAALAQLFFCLCLLGTYSIFLSTNTVRATLLWEQKNKFNWPP